MNPWQLLDTSPIPGSSGELCLHRRGEEFSIRLTRGGELMNSRVHGSEEGLAEAACGRLVGHTAPRLLIGGLGMGFTLAAALRQLGPQAQVTVAELVPAVVAWNREYLGGLTGHPLADPRTTVEVGDVGELLRRERDAFDAILLDVDNGPEGLTRRDNDWLYSPDGLAAAWRALRSGGLLAVWSAGPDRPFSERLRRAGYTVEELNVRAHGRGKGARHTIWIAGR